MPAKARPQSNGGPAKAANRSISGNSTASRASSGASEHPHASNPQFARLREQSTVSESDSKHGAQVLEEFSASAAAATLQRYNSGHGGMVDPELGGNSTQRYAFPPHGSVQPDAIYNDPPSRPDSQQARPDARNGTPQLGANGTDQEKKEKKGMSSTAANEKELREMLDKNRGRDLDSIAREVRSAERSQKAERAKQLYAMRWLQTRCQQGKDSVPRSRVYTHYAQRCGNDRVDTLNPASFGKLVRVIFPGIATRRLGQRGESKYHYVNLTLVDENEVAQSVRAASPLGFGPIRTNSVDGFEFRNSSRFPADSTAFPSHDSTFDNQHPSYEGNPSSQGHIYASPYWQDDESTFETTGSRMYPQRLKFSSSSQQAIADSPLVLPDIHQFLPPNTDTDSAAALSALYRTHCTSLIDAMRYVREKSFFKLFGTFSGTLTIPVSKLFTNASIAPWIKVCDWHAYREIVRFVSQLDLQVIPPPVWHMINRVKNDIITHIRTNYSHYPDHVLHAKIEPATVFARLLERLLRVNETAHAAANLLLNDQMRNMMWHDWVKTVKPRRIVESELPSCGYDQVADMLTYEIRALLEPLDESYSPESGTDFEHARYTRNTGQRVATEGPVERWATFLRSLPSRFTQSQTRVLIHSVNAVGSAVLRDITVAQAQSFGSWWITKCWVDEMMLWMAEMGGFLETGPLVTTPTARPPMSADTVDDGRRVSSRHSDGPQSAGLGIDFNTMPTFAPIQNGPTDPTGPPTATFRFPTKMNSTSSPLKYAFDPHDDLHNDDSGIGMSMHDGFDYLPNQQSGSGDLVAR